jgi:hypothetical protein
MAATKKWTKTQQAQWKQEASARKHALYQKLEDGIAAVQSDREFKRWLRTQAKFYTYSPRNTLLILLQRPDATYVAGYKAWQEKHKRHVRSGEKGIAIFAPMRYTVRKEDHETGEETDVELLNYTIEHVFDISQTDGEPLPEFDVPALTDDAGAEVYAALRAYAESQGLTVQEHDDLPVHGAYSRERQRIIIERAAQLQMTKTLIHEIAHSLDPDLKGSPIEEKETVAEATAFIVSDHFGLDTSSYSFRYIAWYAGQEDGRDILKRVMDRTHAIINQVITGVEAYLQQPIA